MFNSVGTAAGRELLGVKHETDVKLETDDITQKMAIIFRAERDSILIRSLSRLLSAGCTGMEELLTMVIECGEWRTKNR